MKIFYAIWVTILGAILGSFLGCMGYRIPNKIMVGTFKQALYNPKEGEFFYCKDKGKPIWWNGTNWVDATGATV